MIDETKLNILSKAETLFTKFGIRSVSMDDVCKLVGCSKKTIYSHFENKNELITNIAETHKKADQEAYKLFKSESTNAVEEIHKIVDYTRKEIKRINPILFRDLQKYYMDIFCVYHEKHHLLFLETMKENIRWGVEGGLYRPVNVDIVALVFVNMVHNIFDNEDYPLETYGIEAIYQEIIDYHLKSILTAKGQDYYNNYKNNLLK
jgi:TetR/AcrR family transcriptional regulator, cholesterol catabolism regulator